MLDITSPIDGHLLQSMNSASPGEVQDAFAVARAAAPGWRRDYEVRAAALRRFAAAIERDRETLARTLTLETGKPITQSHNELQAFLGRIAYFLAVTPDCLRSQTVHHEGEPAAPTLEESISFDPLGIVGCISAWNYPYFVGGNVFVPALLVGNCVLYKPSELATLTGLAIAERLHAAGVPQGAFATLVGGGDVGRALLALPLDSVCFTGSVRTGQAVAAAVGPRGIPLQLELGGKDATYVCEDADIDAVAPAVADGAFYNTGQSCCSVERLYVHEAIYEPLIERLVAAVRGFTVGNPFDERTYIGPLARHDQPGVLERQVGEALALGGRVLTGGHALGGNFFAPTVLADVPDTASAVQEESFGPLLVVARVRDDAEAIERMNGTRFGLTASVYGHSWTRAEAILGALDVGTCYWNACDRVSPRLPWSGRRDSGTGVTLSTLGVRAFLRPRAWHRLAPAA